MALSWCLSLENMQIQYTWSLLTAAGKDEERPDRTVACKKNNKKKHSPYCLAWKGIFDTSMNEKNKTKVLYARVFCTIFSALVLLCGGGQLTCWSLHLLFLFEIVWTQQSSLSFYIPSSCFLFFFNLICSDPRTLVGNWVWHTGLEKVQIKLEC